jgi:hypothetical protein
MEFCDKGGPVRKSSPGGGWRFARGRGVVGQPAQQLSAAGIVAKLSTSRPVNSKRMVPINGWSHPVAKTVAPNVVVQVVLCGDPYGTQAAFLVAHTGAPLQCMACKATSCSHLQLAVEEPVPSSPPGLSCEALEQQAEEHKNHAKDGRRVTSISQVHSSPR